MDNPFGSLVAALTGGPIPATKVVKASQGEKQQDSRTDASETAACRQPAAHRSAENASCCSTHGMPGVFTRLSRIKEAIKSCYDRLDLPMPFASLYDHVNGSEWDRRAPTSYQATFCGVIERVKTGTDAARGPSDEHLRECVHALEVGTAFLVAAQAPCAKPLVHLMHEALSQCQAAEAAYDARKATEAAYHEARVRGGQKCQARHQPARIEAARLLLLKAPATGWATPTAAVKAILVDLIDFIEKTPGVHLKITESLQRTVTRWIQNCPEVRAAYQTGAARGT